MVGAGDALCHRDDVGRHAVMLVCEHLAGSAEAVDDLVDMQKDALTQCSGSEIATRSAAEVGQLGSGGRFGPVGIGSRIRASDDGRNVVPTALLQPGQESLRRRSNGSATGSGDCERRR